MNEEKTNKYISAVVYFSVKRRKIKYVEIEHKYDYINMEKFHEKIISSLKTKANRLNSIVNNMIWRLVKL